MASCSRKSSGCGGDCRVCFACEVFVSVCDLCEVLPDVPGIHVVGAAQQAMQELIAEVGTQLWPPVGDLAEQDDVRFADQGAEVDGCPSAGIA